ncbi:MAG: nucleotide exchange factor GrpE [Actinomycetota bacterium]|nr:nucleotide exchange factor GrpE [Actinomycetota bacterium]
MTEREEKGAKGVSESAHPKQEKGQKEKKGDLAVLKEELKKKNEEIASYVEMLQRLKAEFENYKKRVERDQAAFFEMASKDIVLKVLPTLDNLERALAASNDSSDLDSFKKGIELVMAQLAETLKKEGLSVIDPVGEKFDPLHHEAFMQVESDEYEEGSVVEVFQKGYALGGRVIRPAVVKVAKPRS